MFIYNNIHVYLEEERIGGPDMTPRVELISYDDQSIILKAYSFGDVDPSDPFDQTSDAFFNRCIRWQVTGEVGDVFHVPSVYLKLLLDCVFNDVRDVQAGHSVAYNDEAGTETGTLTKAASKAHQRVDNQLQSLKEHCLIC